jgi:hypothetical protein
VELGDLHACVKLLRGAKVWRSDCSELTGEIVQFVRSEIDQSPRKEELNLRLA